MSEKMSGWKTKWGFIIGVVGVVVFGIGAALTAGAEHATDKALSQALGFWAAIIKSFGGSVFGSGGLLALLGVGHKIEKGPKA